MAGEDGVALPKLPEGVFFDDGELTLSYSEQEPPWAEGLYRQVVWGTRGLRYRLLEPRVMLDALQRSGWVTFLRQTTPIGAYGLVPGIRSWNGERVPAIYRTFLALRPELTGRSLGRVLVAETRRFLQEQLPRGVVFGFIEDDNTASLAISRRAGYVPIASVVAENYAVLRPAAVAGVRRLEAQERERLQDCLETLYAGHDLTDFDQSVVPEQCWVLERGGVWVAALQAERRRFELVDLGYRGWLKRAVPWIPVVRQLVDPRDYRFLWYQHLWFREDQPGAIFDLMQGVLYAMGHRLANLQFDRRSPVYARWRRSGRLGPLAVFRNGFQVMADLRDLAPTGRPILCTTRGA